MRDPAISTESLCDGVDTAEVIVHFFTGVIVGVLIGLCAAPFLQAWLLWRESRSWDESDRDPSPTRNRL